MIEFLKRQGNFIRIEFWAFTTLFVFVMFFFITNGHGDDTYRQLFQEANIPFGFYSNYFIPQFIINVCLFVVFLATNFFIIPRLMKREKVIKNIVLFLFVFIATGSVFGVANTWIHGYRYANAPREAVDEAIFSSAFFQDALSVFIVLLFYSGIKYSAKYLLSKTDAIQKKYRFITREAIIAAMLWLVILLLLWIFAARWHFLLAWIVQVPYGIAFYSYAFYKVIPQALTKERPFISYLLRSVLIVAILFLPVLILLLSLSDSEDAAFTISFFNTVFQLFVTVPVTWAVYKRKQQDMEEIGVLQKELRQSTASIDFLRSQINPHFLFNALNTLYGTAIQENADRTSEGIQKLGDMMRFMLQENMQEKISLTREIDYLNNYIELQRLRTDTNPNVRIETAIDDTTVMLRIAPMLLIPFVENAFKHGISFREPSHIKVNLDIKDKTLFFDVYNSKHIRSHIDPEKDKSGIGLENVRQRLKLMYPNKHELMIRDTSMEFFIHLTIQLA